MDRTIQRLAWPLCGDELVDYGELLSCDMKGIERR